MKTVEKQPGFPAHLADVSCEQTQMLLQIKRGTHSVVSGRLWGFTAETSLL